MFARANEYNLSDCAHYFLSNVKRLSDVGYVPTTQDILHTRVKTSGIVEVSQTNVKIPLLLRIQIFWCVYHETWWVIMLQSWPNQIKIVIFFLNL